MIMDMHITPLKSKMKKFSFFIRNHSFLKQVRFLSALVIIIIGQNYPSYCSVKPLIICLGWLPLSTYWIYQEVTQGMMLRKIEGYAMIFSEFFTSMLLVFLSIIGLFKIHEKTDFFTNGAIICLIGGVASEVLLVVFGIIFEVCSKCKKKKKPEEGEEEFERAKPKIKRNKVHAKSMKVGGPSFKRKVVNRPASIVLNQNDTSEKFDTVISSPGRRVNSSNRDYPPIVEEDVSIAQFEEMM